VVFAITVVIQLFILWIITQQHHHHSNRSPNDDRHYESGVGRFVASSSSASSIYKLAYDQSYGFFDDITEKDWKRHQQRARTAKSHRFPKDPLRFWYQPGWWYLNNYEPGKYGCMDEYMYNMHMELLVGKDRHDAGMKSITFLATN
jgi:hypothetical protein